MNVECTALVAVVSVLYLGMLFFVRSAALKRGYWEGVLDEKLKRG